MKIFKKRFIYYEHFFYKQKKLILLFFITASRIRYEITSGNIGGAFAVKNMTGAIYVAGALDYETRKRVSFFFVLVLLPFINIFITKCSLPGIR